MDKLLKQAHILNSSLIKEFILYSTIYNFKIRRQLQKLKMNSEENSDTTSRPGSKELAQPGYWVNGELPENVRVGSNTIITADYAFKRFRSRQNPALTIGENCTMEGVHFALGEDGIVQIGNYCYFTNAILLCELELSIGDYVVIGW